MAVPENILSPNEEASMPACVQDGAWLLTEGSVTFTAEGSMQLQCKCGMEELLGPSGSERATIW